MCTVLKPDLRVEERGPQDPLTAPLYTTTPQNTSYHTPTQTDLFTTPTLLPQLIDTVHSTAGRCAGVENTFLPQNLRRPGGSIVA